MYRYLSIEEQLSSPYLGQYHSFGIAAFEICNGRREQVAFISDVSTDEAFAEQSFRVKQKQAAYNAFCKQTGRTKRLDRTQVYGYNKSISGKVAVTNRKRDKNVFDAKNGSYQKMFLHLGFRR